MAASIIFSDKEKVFSQDSRSAGEGEAAALGGRAGGRESTGTLVWLHLSLTLTHNPIPGVFVQVRSNVTHHRQDVTAGGDVDFPSTEERRNKKKI